jgi:hypothetical protein
MASRKRGGPDWDVLKREWLASNCSLNEFKVKKGILNPHFYKQVKAGKWREAKQKIEERTVQKISDKLVDVNYAKWERQVKLWMAIEDQAAHILKQNVDSDGKLSKPMNPQDLKALGNLVESSIRSHKYMRGETVGGVQGEGNTTINFHVQLANVIQEIEKENGVHGPAIIDIPAIDERDGQGATFK